MNIAVLGTGMVGTTIASKLVELGHTVTLGSRSADNKKGAAWVASTGAGAAHGAFADAASKAELVFNCTNGQSAVDALTAAGKENLAGKIVIDVSNPLDFSQGFPPTLFTSGTDSLGERIQRAFPDAKVVKTLNTINCQLMVDPDRVPAETDVFVSGNDAGAKAQVTELLRSFGWKSVIDLGDITTARGTESWLPLWVRLYQTFGTGDFNLKLVRAK